MAHMSAYGIARVIEVVYTVSMWSCNTRILHFIAPHNGICGARKMSQPAGTTSYFLLI